MATASNTATTAKMAATASATGSRVGRTADRKYAAVSREIGPSTARPLAIQMLPPMRR
jgi:hypothetical protein